MAPVELTIARSAEVRADLQRELGRLDGLLTVIERTLTPDRTDTPGVDNA